VIGTVDLLIDLESALGLALRAGEVSPRSFRIWPRLLASIRDVGVIWRVPEPSEKK